MSTALIDGDIVAYMSAVLAQEDAFPPLPGQTEEDCKPTADLKKAKRIAREILDKWEHVAGCTSRRIAMSDRTTPRASFRYQVHPQYKNQRTQERPKLLDDMHDWLIKQHGGEWEPRLEGDDLLGIWQTESDEDNVIVSKDKDMMTIPGRTLIIPHMKTSNNVKPVVVSKAYAADSLFLQVLTGDSIDNYIGAPGIGKAKAAQFLKNYYESKDNQEIVTRWDVIRGAFAWAWQYRPRYHRLWTHPEDPYAEALMNMRCARILHAKDYQLVMKPAGHIRGNKIGLWLPGGDREWI